MIDSLDRSRSARPGWVLGLTSAAEFVVALDVLAVTTALGSIRHDLNAAMGPLEWTLTSYTLCLAGFMLAGAALGDRFGRRRMMMVGLAAFTAGSVSCALAPSAGVLIAGRTVQGVGAALLAPLAVPLVSAVYGPRRRGRALGVVAGVAGLATFAGPLVGGAVTQALGWQAIFWINVPVGLVLLLLVRGRVPESRGPRRALDVRGIVLATAALVALAWGLVRAADAGWTAPDVVAGLVVGVVLAAVFVAAERGVAEPLVDVAFLRSRGFGAVSVATLCHSAVVLGAVFLMAQFLQAELGVGSFGAGVRLLPWTGSMMLVAPVAGRLVDRAGPWPVIVGGLVLAAAGYAWLALVSPPPVSYPSLVTPLLIVGIGNSAVFPAVSAAVSAAAGADRVGSAAGVNNTVRQVGGVLGIAVAALAFTGAGGFTTAATVASGFRAVTLLCTGLAAAGALAGAFAARSGARRHLPQPPRSAAGTAGAGPHRRLPVGVPRRVRAGHRRDRARRGAAAPQ
jgi:EmrB/QacA subfamily drug resistance transporter